MKNTWLNKVGNPSCILFFNGWGMDERVVSRLDFSTYDLCMFSDYKGELVLDEDFSAYESLYLVAWSLGVWNAAKVFSKTKFNFLKTIAINGTMQPISDSEGISAAVFDLTLQNWAEKSRPKFNARVIGGNVAYQANLHLFSNRAVVEQKLELAEIQQRFVSEPESSFIYDVAIIGEQDLIFTAPNQLNSWQDEARIVCLPIPHLPFLYFKTWQEILTI